MKRFDSVHELDSGRPRAVALGTFDGVHLGHRRLVEELVSLARRRALATCALLFRRSPRSVLAGEAARVLTTVRKRLELLDGLGLDSAAVADFTPEVARMSAGEFLGRVLVGNLGARAVVVGRTARMGAGRAAGADELRALGGRLGVEVRVVEPVLWNGAPVSSSLIRDLVAAGDLGALESTLGRRYSIAGSVIRGEGRGRLLGFPTLNVEVPGELLLPRGVYASRLLAGGEAFRSVTNIGRRPTFTAGGSARSVAPSSEGGLSVETHAIGAFPRSISGRVELELVRKLRDERAFEDARALGEQISRDVEAAGRLFEAGART